MKTHSPAEGRKVSPAPKNMPPINKEPISADFNAMDIDGAVRLHLPLVTMKGEPLEVPLSDGVMVQITDGEIEHTGPLKFRAPSWVVMPSAFQSQPEIDVSFVDVWQSRWDCKVGRGVAEKAVQQAEKELGLTIRSGYRYFLRQFGWCDLGADEVYGLGEDVPKHLDLMAITLSERSEMKPRLRMNLLPVMNDGFGNLYCLDTATDLDEENPVVFWDHEGDEEQVPERVADSFSEWFSELIKNG